MSECKWVRYSAFVSGLSSSFSGLHLHRALIWGFWKEGSGTIGSWKRSKRGRSLSCESSALTMKSIGVKNGTILQFGAYVNSVTTAGQGNW